MHSIQVSDDVYGQLHQFARFAGCGEGEVVRRLLDQFQENAPVKGVSGGPVRVVKASSGSDPYLPGRAPRERGIRVRLAGEVLHANSVRDLFEMILRHLGKNGKREAVKSLVPFKTSTQRYLIAEKPIHPNGNRFFVPVQGAQWYMEAHKSYKTAIADLEDFLPKVGIDFQYISG